MPTGGGRDNYFDVLRLVAAAMVLVGHSFALTGHHDPHLPWSDTAELSTFGLLLFFALSGYLVTLSWVREPRLLAFATKRALRFVPGLLVSLVVTAYLFGA